VLVGLASEAGHHLPVAELCERIVRRLGRLRQAHLTWALITLMPRRATWQGPRTE